VLAPGVGEGDAAHGQADGIGRHDLEGHRGAEGPVLRPVLAQGVRRVLDAEETHRGQARLELVPPVGGGVAGEDVLEVQTGVGRDEEAQGAAVGELGDAVVSGAVHLSVGLVVGQNQAQVAGLELNVTGH
jgi:hypothetical protein